MKQQIKPTHLIIALILTQILLCSCAANTGGGAVLPTVSAVTESAAPVQTAKPSPAPTESPTPSPTPTPTPEPEKAKLSVVGDLMVHEWQLDFSLDKQSGEWDYYYGFADVEPYLSDADYTLGNLETTFNGEPYGGYPMFCAPDEFGEALVKAGFDFVSTANNHLNDRWEDGIHRTVETLDKLGLDHTGTFSSEEERNTTFIKEINGIKFAILSYSYGTNGLPLTEGKYWLANLLNEELIESDIATAKALDPDFIIVMPHMGNEYELYPRDVFKDWAKLMLKAGADIILAGHPHVLQPVEWYSIEEEDGSLRDGLVCYSLGNFISSQRTAPRDAGIIMNLEFTKEYGKEAKLDRLSFIPTWVKFRDASGVYDIKVVSVKDSLDKYASGEDTNYSVADIERIKQVFEETTSMMLGESADKENMKNEYEIPYNNVILLQ